MLKKRIIPKFLLRNGSLVKYVKFFENEKIAGNPVSTAKVYNDYGADELIILDIASSEESKRGVREIIERISREVFMPFTVGGGVQNHDDISALLRSGADKVSINTAAIRRPAFVREAARTFGDQCITVSVDYRQVGPGVHRVFINGGRERTYYDPVEWSERMQDSQCGEILLTSIDRDGTMSGYDLDMLDRVNRAVGVPVIVSGGAGNLQHCIDALEIGASAVAISSMFLFTDHSPIKIRSHLWSRGIKVRASVNSRN